jgi:hypothetical protein
MVGLYKSYEMAQKWNNTCLSLPENIFFTGKHFYLTKTAESIIIYPSMRERIFQ